MYTAGNTGTAMTFITPREFRQLKLIERAANTKIMRRQLPTTANVVERQREIIISRMQAVLELNHYHDYMPIAETLLCFGRHYCCCLKINAGRQ